MTKHNSKVERIKTLLSAGSTTAIIAKTVGLPVKEVKAIIKADNLIMDRIIQKQDLTPKNPELKKVRVQVNRTISISLHSSLSESEMMERVKVWSETHKASAVVDFDLARRSIQKATSCQT